MTKASDNAFPSILVTEGSAPSTPASGFGRIYAKTTGLFFIGDNGVEVGPLAASSATSLADARYVRTSGNYTYTGSTAFANVDNTNMNLTITTGARRVLVGFVGSLASSSNAGGWGLDIELDGARLGGTTSGLVFAHQHATAGEYISGSFSYLTDVLSAASHTFKLQWSNSNAAHTISMLGSDPYAEFYVVELPT